MNRDHWFLLLSLLVICAVAASPGTPRRQVFEAPLESTMVTKASVSPP